MSVSYTCQKCGRSLNEKEFYTYRDGRKTELCKKCLTMHIDNFDESTFVWILEKMDLPYIPEEWNKIRDAAFAKDPLKMTGMSVLGKYLSKMKLTQFMDKETHEPYHFADSEKIVAANEKKRQAAITQQKILEEQVQKRYENGEISEAEYKTLMSTETQHEEISAAAPVPAPEAIHNEHEYMSEDELIDPAAELTNDDKIYLAMKWGRLYKPNQWVKLEKHYNEMMASFDIQDADTTSTLLLLCKTYLKMDEAIDIGDFDSYQKLSRVYDAMRKSAKFTAAQNKGEQGDFVDCIGTMVAYCEKVGGQIPKFEIKEDKDIVDTVIKDLKNYNKSLIYQDTALAKQIEDYIKKKEINEQMKKDKEEAKKKGLENYELTDQDIQENLDRIKEEQEQDKIILEQEDDNIT
jgi:hypothetical protein